MSKTLEYYFNPKRKGDDYFESFIYKPSNKKEANLGNLYMIAQIKGQNPERRDIAKKLAETIKDSYYSDTEERREDAFRKSLMDADSFLKVSSRKNLNILDHLSFAIISVSFGLDLNFSKIGNLRMILLRQEEIFDIGKDLDINYSTPNIFPKVVGGKLEKGDQLFVFTKLVFERFEEKGLIGEIKKNKRKKELKKIFKDNKEELKKLHGLIFYLLLKPKKPSVLINIPTPRIPSLNLYEKVYPESPVFREKLKQSIIAIIILLLIFLIGYAFF